MPSPSMVVAAELRKIENKVEKLLMPTYELWIKRREPWLRALEGADQFEEDET